MDLSMSILKEIGLPEQYFRRMSCNEGEKKTREIKSKIKMNTLDYDTDPNVIQ